MLSRSGTCALLAMAALMAPASGQASNGRGYSDLEIREQFKVNAWSIQELQLDTQLYEDLTFELELGGVSYILGLLYDPIRAPHYEAWIVDDAGTHRAEDFLGEMPPSAIYKGDVVDPATGYRIGRASGSAFDGQFEGVAWIEHEDGTRETFWIQPLTDEFPDAPKTAHIVFQAKDNVPGNYFCGSDLLPEGYHQEREQDFSNDGSRDAGDKVCEIALDCDYQYFVWQSSNVKKTQRDAEKVVANMETIYERDVDITYEISLIIVRQTSGSDPYTSNDAGTLLGQFQSYWCTNYSHVGRDTAHLLTGNNINGGIIGIAWLGVICASTSCNGLGYGLSWTTFTSNLATRVGLTSHEVGHNWNAGHCDGSPPCYIMCSGLGGCSNDLTKFSAGEQTQIENFRNSRGCLTNDVNPIALPFFDDFPSTTLNTNNWTWNKNTTISASSVNPPSAPNALRLNAKDAKQFNDDQIRSNEINMTGAGTVNLSYYLEWRETEGTEKLTSSAYGVARNWNDLIIHTADATSQNNFTLHSVDLDVANVHAGSRVRFVAACEEVADNFYVDNVSIVDNGFMMTDGDGGLVKAGGPVRIRVIGPQPNTPVSLFLTFVGAKLDPKQGKHKHHLELLGRIIPAGLIYADERGVGTFEFDIPDVMPPGTLYLQSVIWDSKFTDGYEVSNFVLVNIQP